MTFLAVVLALLLEQGFGHWTRMRRPPLLRTLVVKVQRGLPLERYWRSPAAPLALVVLMVGAAAGVDWALHGRPLLLLLASALILYFCLGARDLADEVRDLLAARERGDAEREALLTRSLLVGPDRRNSRRSLVGAQFIQSHERLLAILLWFFALGPAGAVLYRVVSRMPRLLHETLRGTAAEQTAMVLHAACAWPTARIVALLFALAGSMDDALEAWQRLRGARLGWRDRNWALLAEVPAGALCVEDEPGEGPAVPVTLEDTLQEVAAMQRRALLIMLAGFGVFTAGGYIV